MSDIVEKALARWAPAHYPRQYGSISDDVKSLCDTITALRAALTKAKRGLESGVNQYASRDIHGNIVPGDEQYPWVRDMQIGLDAACAALNPSSGSEPQPPQG